MKCPHCEYEHVKGHYVAGNPDVWKSVGTKSFYKLPTSMEQVTGWNSKTLYACPECGKAFIDI